MSRRSVPLGQGWTVKAYGSADWAVEAAIHDWYGPGWIPAGVPGSVVHDVWRAAAASGPAGGTGDGADGGDRAPSPYVERGSLGYEWVAERAWRSTRTLDVPDLPGAERAHLRFDGVDHEAVVLVDGVELARHAGMFVPFEVALAGIAPGPHRLDVVVGPVPAGESQVGRTSRVRTHKSRMSYGWDFCPRLPHQGIWRPVVLEVTGPARLTDVWARPSWVDAPVGDARVACEVALDASQVVATTIRAELRDGDRVVATAGADVPPGSADAALELEVPTPRPWRPNGLGEPVVHRLTVSLLADDGTALDARTVPVGFRRARLVPNEGGPDGARPYTLEVDGQRVPIDGWNWTPLDVSHGVERPGHLDHLIRLARDARVNVLRVWGGGLIEADAFYDACDAAGILVWQEFSLSSSQVDSVPSDDAAFVDLLRAEARAIVPLRRNHPSLLLWCGGNELADERGPLDETRSPALAALRDVVAELDPDRPFLPSSPSGPRFHNRVADIEEDSDGLWDVHGPWEHQGLAAHNALYDAGTSLLASEFGVEGLANRRQHEALIRPANRWPATRDNAVYRHLGDWWINEPLVQDAFGGRLTDLETLRRASQHLQADGLRYAVEANRRRWPRQAGSLPWQFNESYPNAWCTAVIDHRGDPKPAYFGVARAYRAVHVCARFARWAWAGAGPFRAAIVAWSAEPIERSLRVRGALRRIDGSALAETAVDLARLDDRPVTAGDLAADLGPGLAILDLALEHGEREVLARNRYVVSGTTDLAPLLDVPPATVDVMRREGDGETWQVELAHRGGPAALGIAVDDDRPFAAPGWAEPHDGLVDLLPGERRTIGVRWADAPPAGRRLRVHGWNVDVVVD